MPHVQVPVSWYFSRISPGLWSAFRFLLQTRCGSSGHMTAGPHRLWSVTLNTDGLYSVSAGPGPEGKTRLLRCSLALLLTVLNMMTAAPLLTAQCGPAGTVSAFLTRRGSRHHEPFVGFQFHNQNVSESELDCWSVVSEDAPSLQSEEDSVPVCALKFQRIIQ